MARSSRLFLKFYKIIQKLDDKSLNIRGISLIQLPNK